MASKKRKYDNSYLDYGFTCLTTKDKEEKPQCVICHKVMTNDSMKPAKLKLHLNSQHSALAGKDRTFFERQEASLKKMRLSADGPIQAAQDKVVEASYAVALQIAKQKKPHTIGEQLIKPCAQRMVELVLGKEAERKISVISLSNNTIQRRIAEMSEDIKKQLVEEIQIAPFGLFSVQLDESTDVESCAQLLAFVRYVNNGRIKEEFLFCSALETTTRASDILEIVSQFFETEGLLWKNLCGCCTDGAPAMLGCNSGFQTRVKQLVPEVKGVHCMIHRQALACKTLPESLSTILTQVIRIVNYIKGGDLNSRLFKELCEDMEADHKVLLYHTNVRWLSKGNVTARTFKLREEIKIFCEENDKTEFATWLKDEVWLLNLAYLVDIFGQLNRLNCQMQGRNTNIVKFTDALKAFICKLQLWKRKVTQGNFSMFECLSLIIEPHDKEPVSMPQTVQSSIKCHLDSLESEFQRYFPEVSDVELSLVRNPFRCSVERVPDELQEELIDLQNDSAAKGAFEDKTIEEFWPTMINSYPKTAKHALRTLLPFVSTYLCESAFSTMVVIKTKQRNRLSLEDDMRCALSNITPNIEHLVKNKKYNPSH